VPETDTRGNIPVIHVVGDNLPQAWERAIVACWERGASVRTEYDRTDSDGSRIDPPSRDATVLVEVRDPFAEPRIHKNFPGGPEELEVYRQEVVDGIHDHWVEPADPDKWTYTYHERIFAYKATTDLDDPAATTLPPVDQIEYAINKCAATHYSRRAQAITWIPNADPQTDDPPCLQRLWFRILLDGDEPVLNLNTHWRSRDGYKAWFMNAFALTDLQRVVAGRIGEQLGRPVRVGRYVDISDSFHIYGSYFTEFEPEFAKMKAESDYTARAWPSDHPAVQMMSDEARRKLAENVDYMRGDG
jgi:thymidylate synthase